MARQIRLPVETHRRLVAHARAEGKPIRDIADEAVLEFLKEHAPGLFLTEMPEGTYWSDSLGGYVGPDDEDWNESEAVAHGAIPGREPKAEKKLPTALQGRPATRMVHHQKAQ